VLFSERQGVDAGGLEVTQIIQEIL
jgi:hypothetical protein